MCLLPLTMYREPICMYVSTVIAFLSLTNKATIDATAQEVNNQRRHIISHQLGS